VNVDPLTAPLICPSHLTEVEFQLPLTSDADCARTIVNCTVALLDDAIVPFHVPAMFVAVTTFSPDDGPVEFPEHAETLTTMQTSSATRMASPLLISKHSLGRGDREGAANARQCRIARLAHQM
jgi:hypothetical protein